MAHEYNPTGGHDTEMPAPVRTPNTTSLTTPPLAQKLQCLEKEAQGTIRMTSWSLDADFIPFSTSAHVDSSTYKDGLVYAEVNTRENCLIFPAGKKAVDAS